MTRSDDQPTSAQAIARRVERSLARSGLVTVMIDPDRGLRIVIRLR